MFQTFLVKIHYVLLLLLLSSLSMRNEDILHKLHIEPVLDYIHQYQNNWIQHVYRMPRTRFPRTILNYRPSGKRSLGRPMNRWTENFM